MSMLTEIDSSLHEAMDALGDELFKYLEEAGETMTPKQKEEKTKKGLQQLKHEAKEYLDPFISVFDGMKELSAAVGIGGGHGLRFSTKGKSRSSKLDCALDPSIGLGAAL